MYKLHKTTALYILLYMLSVFIIAIIVFHAYLNGYLEEMRKSSLVLPSIILFITILFLSFISPKYYFVFFIFQLIAFPSVFNYIFPSILLGPFTDITNSPYPFINNIDIYLLFGIFLGLVYKRENYFNAPQIHLIIIALLFSFIINLFKSSNSHSLYLLFAGTYHIRYLILFYILFNMWDIKKYEKELLFSFIISIVYLLIESLIYSRTNNFIRLTSGTLQSNTFGNIIAAIGISLLFISKRHKEIRKWSILGFLISLIIVLLSLNRSSIFSMLISPFIIYFIEIKSKAKQIFYLICISSTLYLFILFFPTESITNVLPPRLQVWDYIDEIDFTHGYRTSETSSIITRFYLFQTSLAMIKDNPIAGIGNGRWNYLKSKYGFHDNVMIDSHNGILSLFSQYGILGIPFIFYIYLFPFKIWQKNKNKSLIDYFIIINIVMFFCDLSNAGISKYQVSSLMIFIMFLSIYKDTKYTVRPKVYPIMSPL